MLCCDPSVLDGMFVCNSRRAGYASLFVFHKIHSTQSIGRHRKFLFFFNAFSDFSDSLSGFYFVMNV